MIALLLVLAGLAPLGSLPGLAAAQCFYLDGSQVTEPDFVPCNGGGSGSSGSSSSSSSSSNNATIGSMCCGLNRPQSTFNPPDSCMSNGLCQSVVTDGQGNTGLQFSRDSCSRPDWLGCLKNVCSEVASDNAPMTPCASTNRTTQWCCGANNIACCALWPNHPDAASIPLTLSEAAEAPKTPASVSSFLTAAQSTVFLTVVPSGVGASVTAGSQPPLSSTPPPSSATPFSVQTAPNSSPLPSLTDGGTLPSSTPPPDSTGTAAAQQNGGDGGELLEAEGGLSTQAVAAIVAGVVVLLVILITIGCFTFEHIYKKRHRAFRAERAGSLKRKIRFGRSMSPYM